MSKKNPAVSTYIKNAPPYAIPILETLRKIIHKVCPQVSEEMKWGKPFYLYQDRVLCATMAFKKHSALVFWKGSLIVKKKGAQAKADLKQLRRIFDIDELLPERELIAYLKLAMHFNEPSTKLPPREKRSLQLKIPGDLARALKNHPKAGDNFKSFTPSKRKDYVYWITGAKTEETRERRLETAIDWIAQGKSRNWKYEESKKKKT